MSANMSVMLIETGVNMGDHAQDVVRAVAVAPGETVEALVERLLTSDSYGRNSESGKYEKGRKVNSTWRLEIRVEEPVPADAPKDPW